MDINMENKTQEDYTHSTCIYNVVLLLQKI